MKGAKAPVVNGFTLQPTSDTPKEAIVAAAGEIIRLLSTK